VELELARDYAEPSSEEVQRLSAEVRELSRQAGELPAAQLGGASIVREVTIEEQIVALLALQLEDARIREVMDTPPSRCSIAPRRRSTRSGRASRGS